MRIGCKVIGIYEGVLMKEIINSPPFERVVKKVFLINKQKKRPAKVFFRTIEETNLELVKI